MTSVPLATAKLKAADPGCKTGTYVCVRVRVCEGGEEGGYTPPLSDVCKRVCFVAIKQTREEGVTVMVF